MNALDIKLCNCACCGKELLGHAMLNWYVTLSEEQRKRLPPPIGGRINGRPWCAACLAPNTERHTADAPEIRSEANGFYDD